MAESLSGSRDELMQYLEQVSGRSLRNRVELDAYLEELRQRTGAAPAPRARRAWAIAKRATLGAGLLIALLQYYLIDVYVQISSMQRVQFLNPDAVPAQPIHSALEVLRFLC